MTSRIEQAAKVLFEGAEGGTWDEAEYWQKTQYMGHAHARIREVIQGE